MRSCEIATLPPSLRSGLRLTAMTIKKRVRNDSNKRLAMTIKKGLAV